MPLAAAADEGLAALARLAPPGVLAGITGAHLLTERAVITGRWPSGRVSAGGACRLLEAGDGWIAVNLPRPDDWELVPAWLEEGGDFDWLRIERAVRTRGTADLVERGRLLGLAVAPDGDVPVGAPHGRDPVVATPVAPMGRSYERAPLVVDLSSLWAGPLCGHLLQRCGARVIKVESTRRPDGARAGPSTFFDLLNAGKASVALDLQSRDGRGALQALLRRADVVIEASRPRALRQLGIDAAALVRERGITWISITGYGRAEPQAGWVAYGDDAAVAAGLSRALYRQTGQRAIVGDAIADPLSGIQAALAGWTAHRAGGGRLVELVMCDVVRRALDRGAATPLTTAFRAPPLRRAGGVARPLGADTAAVLAEVRGAG